MRDERPFMYRCLELARRGLGNTAPNPMVGAVIFHKGKVIGEGWHERAGEPHAEVKAISAVSDKSLLEKSTLCVNLEPCSHQGKTPPCTDLIVRHGIPRVFIAMPDPFAGVNGKGIQRLRDARIEVRIGLLEEEARALNKRFLVFQQKRRPYVILKWAQTRDGFMDRIRYTEGARQFPISNPYSKQLTHRWRAVEQAVLVGTRTVLNDDPQLTTRLWDGPNPLRVILDRNLTIPRSATAFSDEAPTLVFTERDAESKSENLSFVKTTFGGELIKTILDTLYERGIQSLIVEGGNFTLREFLSKNCWDEARVTVGSKRFNNGLAAPTVRGTLMESHSIQSDILRIYKPVFVRKSWHKKAVAEQVDSL